jgi:hypothetical protein
MRRFWFELDLRIDRPHPPGTLLGCGITAFDLNDAMGILQNTVFNGFEAPKIMNVKEDIDIRSLDQGKIIPNMGVVTHRGVWFPLGYPI